MTENDAFPQKQKLGSPGGLVPTGFTSGNAHVPRGILCTPLARGLSAYPRTRLGPGVGLGLMAFQKRVNHGIALAK